MASARMRLAALAVLPALALGTAACSETDVAALQAVDRPGADLEGGQGPGAGDLGGSAGNPGLSGLAAASPELRACLTRNRDGFSGDPAAARDWETRGGQRVFYRVQKHLRFGDFPGSAEDMEDGLLDVSVRYADNTVVVVADPEVVDRKRMSRNLNVLVRKVHRNAGSGGPVPKVEVQASCFPASDMREVKRYMVAVAEREHIGFSSSGPGLDSRWHFSLGEDLRWFGEDLERRFGPRVAITWSR